MQEVVTRAAPPVLKDGNECCPYWNEDAPLVIAIVTVICHQGRIQGGKGGGGEIMHHQRPPQL